MGLIAEGFLSNLSGVLGMVVAKRLFGWWTKRYLPEVEIRIHFDPKSYSVESGYEVCWLPEVLNNTGLKLTITAIDIDLERDGCIWETARVLDGVNTPIRKDKGHKINRRVTFRPKSEFWLAKGDAHISGEVVFDTAFGVVTKSFNLPSGTHATIPEVELDD